MRGRSLAVSRIINFVKGTGEEAGEELNLFQRVCDNRSQTHAQEQWVGYAYAIGMVLSSGCQAWCWCSQKV